MRRSIMARALPPVIGVAVLLAAWELLAWSGWVSEDYFPGIGTIASSLLALAGSKEFALALAATIGRTFAGLALSILVAGTLALCAARFPVLRRMLEPAVDMFRVLPPPAIVPLTVFAIGLGPQLYLFIITFACTWPIYVSMANALASPEPTLLAAGRSLGYSEGEILRRLRIPAAMPEAFTGIRVGGSVALLAAVAAEMLTGQSGLGFMLYDAAFTLRVPDMFALMLVAGCVGVLVNLVIMKVRDTMLRWHVGMVAAADH